MQDKMGKAEGEGDRACVAKFAPTELSQHTLSPPWEGDDAMINNAKFV